MDAQEGSVGGREGERKGGRENQGNNNTEGCNNSGREVDAGG